MTQLVLDTVTTDPWHAEPGSPSPRQPDLLLVTSCQQRRPNMLPVAAMLLIASAGILRSPFAPDTTTAPSARPVALLLRVLTFCCLVLAVLKLLVAAVGRHAGARQAGHRMAEMPRPRSGG